MDGSTKKWLINKDGEILGPLTVEDVLSGILAGDFDVRMEIKAPGSGWRSMAYFPEVASSLRSAGLDLQTTTDSSTNSTAHLTGTTSVQNVTVTDPMMDEGSGEFPETTVVWPQGGSSAETKKASQEPKPSSTPVQTSSQEVKTYQWETSKPAPRSQRVGSYLLWLLVMVVASVGLWKYLEYQNKGVTASVNSAADWSRQAQEQLELGKFREALSLYRQILQQDPTHLEAQRKLVPLLLVVEGQTVEAQRITEQMQMSLTRPEERSEAFNLRGLIELYGGRWPEAKAFFNQSLELDSINALARWNRAMAYYMGEDFDSAATDFSMLKGAYPEAAPLMSLLSLSRAATAAAPLELAHAGQFAFQQEGYLLGLWAALSQGREEAAATFADSLLTSDMDLTSLHYREPALFMEPLRWKKLSEICGAMDGEPLQKWQHEAVLGVCALKVHNLVGAKGYFERSLARNQSEAVQTLLAKVYMAQGEKSRALMLLNPLKTPLADVLGLRLGENDSSYKKDHLERANQLNDPRFALQREYYLSAIALQQQNIDKAKYHFRRAQGLSAEFLPLKSLERKIYHVE